MTDTLKRLEAIQAKVDTTTAQQTRQQYEYEQAVARVKDFVSTLKEEFGVDSLEDAQALLTELTYQEEQLLIALEEEVEKL